MVEDFATPEEAMAYIRQWIPRAERVLCYLSSPPTYWMVVGGVKVELGTPERAFSQQRVRAAVAHATRYIPEYLDQRDGKWRKMLAAILTAREDIETPEAEEYDLLLSWLAAYLGDRRPIPEDDQANYLRAVQMELPIQRDGVVLINATNLTRWVVERRVAQVTTKQVALLLRRYGAQAVRVYRGTGDERRWQRYWELPDSMLPEFLREDNTVQNTGGADGADRCASENEENAVQNAGGADGADNAHARPNGHAKKAHHPHHTDNDGLFSDSQSAPHLHHAHHIDNDGLFDAPPLTESKNEGGEQWWEEL
jgi:hypothetical protein